MPRISPYKGLSLSLIFSTTPCSLSSSLSLSLTHWHSPLFIFPYALVSSGSNELSILAQKAVTEVFIKDTAICKVPRTGKSRSSKVCTMKQKRGRFGCAAELDDRLSCGWSSEIICKTSGWTLGGKKALIAIITKPVWISERFSVNQQLSPYTGFKMGHQAERGAWMLCYAAVHFQYITAVIILKWLQLVKCQAWFALSRWLADKVAQR